MKPNKIYFFLNLNSQIHKIYFFLNLNSQDLFLFKFKFTNKTSEQKSLSNK